MVCLREKKKQNKEGGGCSASEGKPPEPVDIGASPCTMYRGTRFSQAVAELLSTVHQKPTENRHFPLLPMKPTMDALHSSRFLLPAPALQVPQCRPLVSRIGSAGQLGLSGRQAK